MDMIKVTKEMIPDVQIVDVFGNNNAIVKVKKYIPYNLKELMAYEYSMYTSITDSQNSVIYTSFKEELVKCLLVLKYYTNVDVTEMDSQDDWHILFDWVVMNDLYSGIMDVIRHDFEFVLRIKDMINDPARMIFNKTNSLEFKLNKTFGSMLGGQDLAEAVAKSEQVNNTMISMIDAYREKKKDEAQNPMRKSKISLKNGSIVNIAKKNN